MNYDLSDDIELEISTRSTYTSRTILLPNDTM